LSIERVGKAFESGFADGRIDVLLFH
jgi:hypothetical protein